jgi:DNA-binding LacI/PurR family transcriptional regulator
MKKSAPKMPAKMADIAKLAGVSASTVSRALAGSSLVAKKKSSQILRIAREHGYVVNSTARNLRLQRTEAISVVIPLGHEAGQPLTDPFFVEMLGHLADEVTKRGYSVYLQKILPPMGDWLARLIGSQKSDGIIIVGQSTEHEVIAEAAKHYLPIVVWGGRADRQAYCTVGTDNEAGARAAVDHLIRLGRRRIVFFGDPTSQEIKLRYDGYRVALKDGGLLEDQQTVTAHLTPDASYDAMRKFIEGGARFDAVFAASDVVAISAIRAITAAGRSVPADVAVVGYDDISLAAHTNPTLTTVRQDLKRGARAMVDLVFRRIAGEDADSITLPVELIVRESSGASRP